MRTTLLILMALLPCLILAATLSVKQDGSGDYTVIQAALDAASPGDTVLVHPGRYFENLTIQTSNITLMSLEATTGDPAYIDSTIIDGDNTDRCIRAMQDEAFIRGFSLTKGLSIGAGGGVSISKTTFITNCKIFHNKARTGGGINIIGSAAYLSGVEVYNNYALQLGGGIYATAVTGFPWNISFDPINRCSIYNNRAGAGQDIYIQHADQDLDMPLDTFSVAEPSNYYAVYLSDMPIANNYQINFDILNAHHQEIDSDLYVSTVGDDANDGLSPATALKTIHEAIYRVAADSLNQNTVHILPGDYSRTDNDQVFPIAMKSWVIVQGSGIDTTTVIGEPHPEMYEYTSTWIFSMAGKPNTFLSDMSITARNTLRNCVVMSSGQTYSNMNFFNLRIHDIAPHESYTSSYNMMLLVATNKRECIWDNVVVEDISINNGTVINIMEGISEDGTISAFKGTFRNFVFRNAISTYTSSSVWAMPLASITSDKELSFENCEFSNLTIQDDNSIAIQVNGIQYPQQQNHFSLYNCLFSNNISPGGDIGGIASICSANNPRIDIINCTFAGNQGDTYTLKTNGEVNIVNSIFDNDTPYQIKIDPVNGDPNEHSNLTIDHSLIKDGIDGILPYPMPGNTIEFLPSSIDADPLFAGGFDIHDPLYYSLSELSPCIDSGTPEISELNLPPYDLDGNWRVWNNRIDMGAFEFGSQPWVSNDDPVLPEPGQIGLMQNYPNPFNPSTTISYSLPTHGKVRLDIYNIKGQLVKTLINEDMEAGLHSIIWNGKDTNNKTVASGIYFYRLSSPSMTQTKRMLLMK